jgi:UDP-N-acetylglucosamine 3-dehydrogenase
MKVTVIGGGIMGANHARILHSMGKLDRIVESNPESRLKLSQIYQDKVVSSIPYDSDCYVIATPTFTHYDVASKLVAAGKSFLIEKPVCKTSLEASNLLSTKRKDTIVAVGHVERFNPIVTHTKEWISQREVSIINSYRLGYCDRITDVGVVLDLAIHDIDVLSYLLDDKVVSVQATGIYKGKPHEQYTKAFLRFSKGTLGCIEVSWIHPAKIRKLEVVGDIYHATADYLQQTFSEEYEYFVDNVGQGFSQKRVKEGTTVSLAKTEPLRLELEDFLNAVENKTKPKVTLEDGIQALKVVEAILSSLQTNSEVPV